MSVGDPPKPVADPEWKGVKFLTLEPFESNKFTVSFQKYVKTGCLFIYLNL